MRAADLIIKKRDGKALTDEEINFLIDNYTKELIPDYQMAAWAMAVFFRGMTKEETRALTQAMMRSGETIDLSPIQGTIVDKHSTGGVGDTTTIVLAPLVAAAGVPVAKMSGRGLGHTGGTIDKLETIPGMRLDLTREEFIDQVNRIGVGIVGQTGNLVPADKKLYALRDVTGTVESLPLIAASIMSKKLASGAHSILLDVKTGSGAFMKTYDEARALAREMVDIGRGLGHPTIALITDMDQPLGYAVGNALEVKEAIETLQGKGPEDLTELCLTIGAHLLVLAKSVAHQEEAYQKLKDLLYSGAALDKLAQLIEAQGGNPQVVEDPDLLPKAPVLLPVLSDREGYVNHIDCFQIGHAAMLLGAGRASLEDKIDPGVGIQLCKKVGDYINKGDVVAYIHAAQHEQGVKMSQGILDAYRITETQEQRQPLIHGVVTG